MTSALVVCRNVLIPLVVIQSCICAVGYVGNVITCVVIASNKSMRTSTNIYLFNLAIADLIMLTAGLKYFTVTEWYFSKNVVLYSGLESNCYIVSSILHASFAVSIMTITALTIERYLAICHPFLARRLLSLSRAIKLIIVIWIIGIAFGSVSGSQPHMDVEEIIAFCKWKNTMPYILEAETFIFFALPFVVLIVLYILIGKTLSDSSKIQKTQSKDKNVESIPETPRDDNFNKKVFNMLITVVAVFFVAWAPYHIGRFIYKNNRITGSDRYNGYCVLVTMHSVAFFISSAINPIIYSAMSNKFRHAFKEALTRLWHISSCKSMAKVNEIHEVTESNYCSNRL